MIKSILVLVVLATAALADIPFALQGVWSGALTYSATNGDLDPSAMDCCTQDGTYTVQNVQETDFNIGSSTVPLSNVVGTVVDATSVTVTVEANADSTPCATGLTANFSLTGVSARAFADCYVGTFAFDKAFVGFAASFPCTFRMTAAGVFQIDWLYCYWQQRLTELLYCPGEVSPGLYGPLRAVVPNQCASVVSTPPFAYSSWTSNPAAQAWVHVSSPPAADCTPVQPVNGASGSCGATLADGATCTFGCASGYSLQGDALLTCNNGVIQGTQTCAALPCGGGVFSCSGVTPCRACKTCDGPTETACTASHDTVCADVGGKYFDASTNGFASAANLVNVPTGFASRTIITYAYLPSTSTVDAVVWSFANANGDCDDSQLELTVEYRPEGLRIAAGACGNGAVVPAIPAGRWYYIAVTYDEGTGQLWLFVSNDGVYWNSRGEEPTLNSAADSFTLARRAGQQTSYQGLLVKYVRAYNENMGVLALTDVVADNVDACVVVEYDFQTVNPLVEQVAKQAASSLVVQGNGGVVSPTVPLTCGALVGGVCQVGFVNPPQCCTRLSDQRPVANASASGPDITLAIVANTLPVDYAYSMGLTLSTSSLFQCEALQIVTTAAAPGQQRMEFHIPVSSLPQCLTRTATANGFHFQGFVAMGLRFAPWGQDAYVGLYFWSINIEVVNATEAVSLLSVVPELLGNGLDVEIIPTGTLRHCLTVPCTVEDPNYFSRVGDTEFYMVMVDTGGKAASTSVTAVIFEDRNHVPQGAVLNPTILPMASGLNVTFGFTVPANTETVRFIRVAVSVDFFNPSELDGVTDGFVAQAQRTLIAQSLFEVSGASSVSFSLLVLAVLAVTAWAF